MQKYCTQKSVPYTFKLSILLCWYSTYFCRFPRESPTLFFNSSFPGLSTFSFRPANPPSGISPFPNLLFLKQCCVSLCFRRRKKQDIHYVLMHILSFSGLRWFAGAWSGAPERRRRRDAELENRREAQEEEEGFDKGCENGSDGLQVWSFTQLGHWTSRWEQILASPDYCISIVKVMLTGGIPAFWSVPSWTVREDAVPLLQTLLISACPYECRPKPVTGSLKINGKDKDRRLTVVWYGQV